MRSCGGLDGVLAQREVDVLLVLLFRLEPLLVLRKELDHALLSIRNANLGQPPADRAGLLDAEVEGQVLLALVEFAKVLTRLGVGNSQDTCDRLADCRAVVLVSAWLAHTLPQYKSLTSE